MDELFKKYSSVYRSNEFLAREQLMFPMDTSFRNRLLSEYMDIISFYLGKMSNEDFYTGDQVYVINDTLSTINGLIEKESYETAEVYIVALELLLDMQIKFRRTLAEMIENNVNLNDLVDVNRFFGQRDDGGFKKKK